MFDVTKLRLKRFFYILFLISLPSLAEAASCKTDRDCPRNFICVETSGDTGVCVVDNNRPCRSNGNCPTGWSCIEGTCSKGGSGQSCTHNGQCKTGYVCCNSRCRYSTCPNRSLEPEGFLGEQLTDPPSHDIQEGPMHSESKESEPYFDH